MPRIRCHYVDCVFLDERFCSAGSVEIDPDVGCTTFQQASVLLEDEELIDEEWDDLGFDEDEDDDEWLDDDF